MLHDAEPTSGSLDDQSDLHVNVHKKDVLRLRVLSLLVMTGCVLLLPIMYALLIGGTVMLCFGGLSMLPHAATSLALGLMLQAGLQHVTGLIKATQALLEE